jgi:hypothetical protein
MSLLIGALVLCCLYNACNTLELRLQAAQAPRLAAPASVGVAVSQVVNATVSFGCVLDGTHQINCPLSFLLLLLCCCCFRQLDELAAVYPNAKLWEMQVCCAALCAANLSAHMWLQFSLRELEGTAAVAELPDNVATEANCAHRQCMDPSYMS